MHGIAKILISIFDVAETVSDFIQRGTGLSTHDFSLFQIMDCLVEITETNGDVPKITLMDLLLNLGLEESSIDYFIQHFSILIGNKVMEALALAGYSTNFHLTLVYNRSYDLIIEVSRWQ